MAPKQSALFEPLSPSINIPQLLSTTPNFKAVKRIDAKDINSSNLARLQALIQEHVVKKGLPLVLENWHLRADWPKWIFNPDWLKENHGQERVSIRDIPRKADIPMTLQHYINNLGKLTSKFTPQNYTEYHQRLYGKDLDCPPVWRTQLSRIIPSSTFYLSPQADLMSSLPASARAENMMCYIGHEGTYTPAHKEMCGSLGQNIMVHASKNGPNSEAGSSIWFMTQMADRDIVAEYWLSTLGHDIEVEAHFASLESLKRAPFTVYIVEQKVGDYVLVPPLAPHQVWNRGTSTMKAAWNRTTVDTLRLAIDEALPKARLVCRDEQYKNRSMIYDTLKIYTRILQSESSSDSKNAPSTIREDYIKLFALFNEILLNECFSPLLPPEANVELVPCDYNVQCSFCRANIFNRFLSCKKCMPKTLPGEDDDPYDVCMECYASGRSCFCVSGLSWMEQYPWQSELLVAHAEFRRVVINIQKSIPGDNPKPFSEALVTFHKKPLARICQEAMKLRPVIDLDEEEEPDDDEDIARKSKNGQLLTCHVCCHKHENWKCAMCTNKNCSKAYCYGNLWRAFDMDPYKDVLAKYDWKCPYCLGICSCGACRRRGKTSNPYVPKGTILGIVTKHVADPRSVESLVDFGKGNAGWVGERVMRGKRRSADVDGDNVDDEDDTLNKYGGTFPISDTSTPLNEQNEQNEDSLFMDDSDNMQFKDVQNLYKADLAAAGLEVAAIPIDPALGGGHSAHFEEDNIPESMASNYARLFEHPPNVAQPSFGNELNGSYNGVGDEANASNVEEIHYFNGLDSGAEYALDQRAPMAPMELSTSSYNDQFHTILPSPSAMLTGAAPTETTGKDESQGMDESMNTNLTALERNPLAFLAAAGLMHSQAQEREELARSWQYPNTDNAMFDNRYMDGYVLEAISPEVESEVIDDNDQTQTDMSPPKARPSKSRKDKDKVIGDLDMPISVEDWNWRARLDAEKRSHKKKPNGSHIVVLRISTQAWRRFEEEEARKKEQKARRLVQAFGKEQVTTDIRSESTRGRKPGTSRTSQTSPLRFVNNTTQSIATKRKVRTPPERDAEDHYSESDIDLDDDGPSEVIPKKQARRSLRTGELVEGLTKNNPVSYSRRRSSTVSVSSGKKRGRPSIVRNSLAKAEGMQITASESPSGRDEEKTDHILASSSQAESATQSTSNIQNNEQEMSHNHEASEDDMVQEPELGLPNVDDTSASPVTPFRDALEEQPIVLQNMPEVPTSNSQDELDPEPEEDMIPGTEAYKLAIARALQEGKSAAIRAIEQVSDNDQDVKDTGDDEGVASNSNSSNVRSPIQIVINSRNVERVAPAQKTNSNLHSAKPKKLKPSRPLSHRPGKVSKDQAIKDTLSGISSTPLRTPKSNDAQSSSPSNTMDQTESFDSGARKRLKTSSAKVIPQARPSAAVRKLLDGAASFTPLSKSRRHSLIQGTPQEDQKDDTNVFPASTVEPGGEIRRKRGRPPKSIDTTNTTAISHRRATKADDSSPDVIEIPRRRTTRFD